MYWLHPDRLLPKIKRETDFRMRRMKPRTVANNKSDRYQRSDVLMHPFVVAAERLSQRFDGWRRALVEMAQKLHTFRRQHRKQLFDGFEGDVFLGLDVLTTVIAGDGIPDSSKALLVSRAGVRLKMDVNDTHRDLSCLTSARKSSNTSSIPR